MIISVTYHHIMAGHRRSCRACPVALALCEQFPDAQIHTDTRRIVIGEEVYLTPPHVRAFIGDFDYGTPRYALFPFMFDLPIPQEPTP